MREPEAAALAYGLDKVCMTVAAAVVAGRCRYRDHFSSWMLGYDGRVPSCPSMGCCCDRCVRRLLRSMRVQPALSQRRYGCESLRLLGGGPVCAVLPAPFAYKLSTIQCMPPFWKKMAPSARLLPLPEGAPCFAAYFTSQSSTFSPMNAQHTALHPKSSAAHDEVSKMAFSSRGRHVPLLCFGTNTQLS